MSILIDRNTRVMTQGITGKTGQFHTRMGVQYANGKQCYVAGVNPKKAGENFESAIGVALQIVERGDLLAEPAGQLDPGVADGERLDAEAGHPRALGKGPGIQRAQVALEAHETEPCRQRSHGFSRAFQRAAQQLTERHASQALRQTFALCNSCRIEMNVWRTANQRFTDSICQTVTDQIERGHLSL